MGLFHRAADRAAALQELKSLVATLELRVQQLESERAQRAAEWEVQQLELGRMINRLRTALQRQEAQRSTIDRPEGVDLLKWKGGR